MAQHIHAVTLVVPDYDAAIAFYVHQLGFRLAEDITLGEGKRWVRVCPPGAQQGGLILAQAHGAAQTAAVGNQTGGRVGFFLVTDDFDHDRSAMQAKGIKFEESPRHEPYGKVAVWQDPFGNRWDLIEWA